MNVCIKDRFFWFWTLSSSLINCLCGELFILSENTRENLSLILLGLMRLHILICSFFAMCCLCDACKWGWRPLGITTKKGINAGCINFTQLTIQWKYTLANWPRFCTPFCQYCLRLAFLLQMVSWKAETVSTGNCTASSTIKVVAMF